MSSLKAIGKKILELAVAIALAIGLGILADWFIVSKLKELLFGSP